ncbi:MAG: type II secretion system protein [bacterium]|nr:type II secretion system protein [bacterium]
MKPCSGKKKKYRDYETIACLKRAKGFTLLEVLISAAIISVLSVIVYAVFSSGVKTWKKAQDMRFLEKSVFGSLQEMTVDIRNCVETTLLPFEGSQDSISFSGLITKGLDREFGLITYCFDESRSSIMKIEKTYPEAVNEEGDDKKTGGKALICNINKFSLTYCYMDDDAESYVWKDTWETEGDSAGIPRAVKIFIELDKDGIKLDFEKMVLIPISLSGRKKLF